MKNRDKPITPIYYPGNNGLMTDGDAWLEQANAFSGLTKREYFAAMAMQGFLAGQHSSNSEVIIETSVKIADELLQQLEK